MDPTQFEEGTVFVDAGGRIFVKVADDSYQEVMADPGPVDPQDFIHQARGDNAVPDSVEADIPLPATETPSQQTETPDG